MRLWLNSSSFSTRCTDRPRIDWATRFRFRGEVPRFTTLARASFSFTRRGLDACPILLPLRFLVGRVAVEGARRRELAELHAHHVFADQHGDVLLAVVDAEGEADELRHDGGPARPGLDHFLAARRLGRIRLLEQIAVDERTFPN